MDAISPATPVTDAFDIRAYLREESAAAFHVSGLRPRHRAAGAAVGGA